MIGFSLALIEVAKVVLTVLNEEKGTDFANELGENALFVKRNVTSAEDWAAVVAKAEEKFGPVNIFVNNASITMAKSILETTEYRRIVDINLIPFFYCETYVSIFKLRVDHC